MGCAHPFQGRGSGDKVETRKKGLLQDTMPPVRMGFGDTSAALGFGCSRRKLQGGVGLQPYINVAVNVRLWS
jgi:hypothetical protein